MNYFNKFPAINYAFEFPEGVRLLRVTDIALNLRVRKQLLSDVASLDEYDIEDGETPEIISHKLYGRPYYHWTIMLLNLRFDYLKDFPMNDSELQAYVEDTYGAGNANAIHQYSGQEHWENDSGDIIFKMSEERFNILHPGENYQIYLDSLQRITNLEYETIRNDAKRRIFVLNKAYLSQVTSDIERLLNV